MVKVEEKIEIKPEIENVPQARIYSSFDDFFHEYAIKNNIPLNWKGSVKLHLQATDSLKDQSKWLSGLKHFGI